MAKREQRAIPTAEWVASLIGGLIVLGTVGFLAFEAFRRGDQEPVLTISIVQVREKTGSYVVEVEVRNQSRGAAADVHLVGSDRTADGHQIQALATLDYVAGFSSRRASLVFQSDPGSVPKVRIAGYSRP